jgi:hypothetical protein
VQLVFRDVVVLLLVLAVVGVDVLGVPAQRVFVPTQGAPSLVKGGGHGG